MGYMADEMFRKYGVYPKNEYEEELFESITYMSFDSISSSCGDVSSRTEAVNEVLEALYYVNDNLEKVSNIIIKQNLMVLRRTEELMEKLNSIGGSSISQDKGKVFDNVSDRLDQIEMKINYLIDNK